MSRNVIQEWTVLIGANEIRNIENCRTDRKSTDWPRTGESAASRGTFTIIDSDGDFSTTTANNWWVRNSFEQDGVGADVKIRIGTKVVYSGTVIRTNYDVQEGLMHVECSDGHFNLRNKNIEDFGIEREAKLARDTSGENTDIAVRIGAAYYAINQQEGANPISRTWDKIIDKETFTQSVVNPSLAARERARLRSLKQIDPRNGIYNLRADTTPPSKGSVTIKKSSTQEVTIVDETQVSGVLDPNNVEIRDQTIISEGAPIPVSDADKNDFPQIEFKSPHRWIDTREAVKKIVQQIGDTNPSIQKISRQRAFHNSILGRPGYETLVGRARDTSDNIDPSKPIAWQGYVTDMMLDGDYIYMLFSVNRGRPWFSEILRYDKRDDSIERYFRFTTLRYQTFTMTKVGDHLVVGMSAATVQSNNKVNPRRPTEGSYDSAVDVMERKSFIQSIDTTASNKTSVDLVARNASIPYQLGTWYQFGGFGIVDETGALSSLNSLTREESIYPTNRRKLYVYDNKVYYYFARSLSSNINQCGVARVAVGGTPEIVLQRQTGDDEHLGDYFIINGSSLNYFATFRTQTGTTQKSQMKVYPYTLT